MKVKTVVVKPYSKEDSLLMSILLFIMGVIIFNNPKAVASFLGYIFGAFLILSSLFRYFAYRRLYKEGNNYVMELSKGIILLVLGLISIFFSSAIEAVFRIIVAAYILYMGINRLIFAISAKKEKLVIARPSIILSCLIILFAVMLAFLPELQFSIIGLFIIAYAVIEIIAFIIFSSNKKKKKNEINEAQIVSEVTEEIKNEESR